MASTPPPTSSSSGGAHNFLTQKVGPLPVWGWAVALIAGFYLYSKISGGSSSSAGTAASAGQNAQATNIPTETITLPSGASYTGPAGSVPQNFVTASTAPIPTSTGSTTAGSGGATGTGTGSAPGQTTTATAGSGGSSTPSSPGQSAPSAAGYSGYTLLTQNVANTVNADLAWGVPVYYAANVGQQSPLLPVSGGAGAGWLAGGQPLGGNPSGPAGSPSGFYVASNQAQFLGQS